MKGILKGFLMIAGGVFCLMVACTVWMVASKMGDNKDVAASSEKSVTVSTSKAPVVARTRGPKKKQQDIQKSITEIRKILTGSGAKDVTVTGKMTSVGRALITVTWPGFAYYSESQKKDLMHGLIKVPLSLYDGGGHEITFRNYVRDLGKVTHSSWSGIKTKLY